MLNFSLSSEPVEKQQVEALVLPVFKAEPWPVLVEEINKELGGRLLAKVAKERFEGKTGQMVETEVSMAHKRDRGLGFEKVVLLGLDKKEEFDDYKLRKAFGRVVLAMKKRRVEKAAIWVKGVGGLAKIGAVAEAAALADYQFTIYKTDKDEAKKELKEIVLVMESLRQKVAASPAIDRAELMIRATYLARDLVNEPASKVTPSYLAREAQRLAHGNVSVKVRGRLEIKKLGMGGVLGVAQGSDEEPKLIELHYRPAVKWSKGAKVKKVVICGKGITFDAGGLSIKSGEAMQTMKIDMAGAAAVLGVFSVLNELQPKAEVIGLIAACENMPSGRALKPGDIVKTYPGKTIEILNTDAEGRVTLADVLAYGVENKPDYLIDLATLTGACMVALGQQVAGLLGNDDGLMAKVKQAAVLAGEKVWPLPLEEEYQELIKSSMADYKNITDNKYGGAITAALLLREFIGKSKWAHLDIAGPAFEEKGTATVPKGGSGFGVRTVLNLLIGFS